MELIGGESLRQRVEGGALPQDEALDIAGQVCDALDYAHGRGVIHRDIKPENILLEKRGDGRMRVRVADFGLARLVQRGQRDFFMTAPNRLMGTPDYMAPEQRRRPGEVDARADVYALGVVMYEMLAGQLPLGKFAPPSKSAALNRIVMRCLEPVPAHRYASVSDVRKELASLGGRRPRTVFIGGGIGAMILVIVLAIWMGHKPSASARKDLSSAASSRPANIRVEPARPDNHRPPLPPNEPPKVGMLVTGPVFAPESQVPPPYTFGPRFRSYSGAPAGDYLQRMEREHGANRIVHLYIDDLPDDQQEQIVQRLKTLTGATSTFTSGNNKSLSIHLAPVRDIDALAKQIDFGKVTSIDPKTRAIEVLANSKTR
jgi:serine/threonine protein kinase